MRVSGGVSRWRRAGLSGVRLVVLLAALAGLFAMHGLSDHGATHPGSTPTHHAAASSDAADPGAMSHAPAAGGHVATAAAAVAGDVAGALGAAADDTALGAGQHAAMGLCLAVLAGAAVLALRRLRTCAWPTARRLGDAAGRALPARARAPDPPDLHVLSIQRC